MTIRQIMKAKNIICTVPEARKAEAVARCLEGEISPWAPASILRCHKSVFFYLDKDSAALLSFEPRTSEPRTFEPRTSRDRVLKAIEHKEPDRVPLDLSIRQEVLRQLMDHIGTEDPEEVNRFLGIDIRGVGLRPEREFLRKGAFCHPRDKWVIKKGPGIYEDEWGIQYYTDESDRYFGFYYHPLAQIKSLDQYRFPNIHDPNRLEDVIRTVEEFGDQYIIMGSTALTLFEQAWQLRGYEQFIIDMCENRAFVEELLDKLLEYRTLQCQKYVELGVDIIALGDDFGMQDRIMVSPDLWREYFKPRMKELISRYSQGHKVYTMYHSDGYIEPIIDDLIEIGIDILNPIQPESMDPCQIKRKYRDRLTLHGTISVQTTLPRGTEEEVETVVKRIIKECAPGGGLILVPTHAIEPDTRVENVITFYKTALEFGKYPISFP